MGYIMVNSSTTKTGKSGKRGIPTVDKTQDYDFFIDEYTDPKTKKKFRLGHATMAHQTNNALTRIAPELKISKSMLIRRVLESFVKYHDEAKAIGGQRFFEAEPAFETWISERNTITQLLKQITEQDQIMNDNSKSPEIKMLSQQLTTLAKMINLTHKNLL
jgi:hypothetical protein